MTIKFFGDVEHLCEMAKKIDETIDDFSSINRKEALAINRLMIEGAIGDEEKLIELINEGLDKLSVECWQKYHKEVFYRLLKLKAFW